jgi:hypothetical protein
MASFMSACGSSVCDDVQSKVSACYASAECDADTNCATSKASYMADANACDNDLVKALVDSCDQSTITVSNQCACSLN